MRYVTSIVLLSFTLAPAESYALHPDDKKQIIERCTKQMEKYGYAMVKACVDQDIKAEASIDRYLELDPITTKRCYDSMIRYGFNMVKACIEQDLKAKAELGKY